MDITGLTSSTNNDPSAAAQKLTNDFDTFLTLLTTQLKNQDPLSPMESAEFTNQIVAFSNLEQQIAQSDKLDNLLSAEKTLQAATAVSYLGKTIEVPLSATQLTDGNANIAYILPPGADEVTVTIFDGSGGVLQTLDGHTEEGRNALSWDGKDSFGNVLPDDTYTISVGGLDDNGDPLEDISVIFSGVAEDVLTEAGETFLRVGNVAVALNDVIGVRETPTIADQI